MTIEEAIKTALFHETRVREVYREGLADADDERAEKFYRTLVGEEEGHILYLRDIHEEWKKNGILNPKTLRTALPDKARITKAIEGMKRRMDVEDRGKDLARLEKALDLETETASFYARMVDELPDGEKDLFERFLEIEEGHKAIVQAEIDSLSGTGFWFDIMDFSLETS